jgi:hypothetical protein
MLCVPEPTAVGMYVTEQLAVILAPVSVQLAEGAKLPTPFVDQVTVPEGVFGGLLRVTVAVHVALAPRVTGVEQVTVVVVDFTDAACAAETCKSTSTGATARRRRAFSPGRHPEENECFIRGGGKS